MPPMPPRVDVVIPCYNEVKVLEQSVSGELPDVEG